jgi:hypothetical protein
MDFMQIYTIVNLLQRKRVAIRQLFFNVNSNVIYSSIILYDRSQLFSKFEIRLIRIYYNDMIYIAEKLYFYKIKKGGIKLD